MQRPRIWTRNLSAERAKLRSYKSVCPKEHQILGCTGQCEEATWQNKMGWVTPNIRTWNKNPNEERANLMSFKADSRKRPLISGCNWGTTCMWFMYVYDVYVVSITCLDTKDLDQESQRRTREVEDLQTRLSQGAAVSWQRFAGWIPKLTMEPWKMDQLSRSSRSKTLLLRSHWDTGNHRGIFVHQLLVSVWTDFDVVI